MTLAKCRRYRGTLSSADWASEGGGQSHRSVTGVWVSLVSEARAKLRIFNFFLQHPLFSSLFSRENSVEIVKFWALSRVSGWFGPKISQILGQIGKIPGILRRTRVYLELTLRPPGCFVDFLNFASDFAPDQLSDSGKTASFQNGAPNTISGNAKCWRPSVCVFLFVFRKTVLSPSYTFRPDPQQNWPQEFWLGGIPKLIVKTPNTKRFRRTA